MQQGLVKNVIANRGFLFVRADSGSEYFCHFSTMEREGISLQVGDRVTFETGPGRNGREQVTSIRLVR
jgi:cold shock CspA family protein